MIIRSTYRVSAVALNCLSSSEIVQFYMTDQRRKHEFDDLVLVADLSLNTLAIPPGVA